MTKARKFELHISLGNDAMQTYSDVANALIDVTERVLAHERKGKIMDINGNSVGGFKFI